MSSATIRLQGAVIGQLGQRDFCPTPDDGCIIDSAPFTNATSSPNVWFFAIEAADGTCGTFRIDIGQ